jgi:D-galactarolactone isomerase
MQDAPRRAAPAGACDCHIHIYDASMPLAPTAAGPGPSWATLEAYARVRERLGTQRAVVVQPTAYGTDNRVTMQAVQRFGADARAVVVVNDGVPNTEFERLHAAGARGVRFQMLGNSAPSWEMLEPVAARVAPLGWHVQLQMDGRHLHEREAQLMRLPCTLVIDHVGKFLEPVAPGHPGFRALLRLLATGRCWLKLAAPYEVSKVGAPNFDDVGVLAKAAIRAAPERMIWES